MSRQTKRNNPFLSFLAGRGAAISDLTRTFHITDTKWTAGSRATQLDSHGSAVAVSGLVAASVGIDGSGPSVQQSVSRFSSSSVENVDPVVAPVSAPVADSTTSETPATTSLFALQSTAVVSDSSATSASSPAAQDSSAIPDVDIADLLHRVHCCLRAGSAIGYRQRKASGRRTDSRAHDACFANDACSAHVDHGRRGCSS